MGWSCGGKEEYEEDVHGDQSVGGRQTLKRQDILDKPEHIQPV